MSTQKNIVDGYIANCESVRIGDDIHITLPKQIIGWSFGIIFIGLIIGYLIEYLAFHAIVKPLAPEHENILYITSILWLIAFICIMGEKIRAILHRVKGEIYYVNDKESSYLKSLITDLEKKNVKNSWQDAQYITMDSELIQENVNTVIQNQIARSYYLVKTINRSTKDLDFNALTNIEKIDSSSGNTFSSLSSAIRNASDNAIVVIAPPGGGKTVSLRHLAILMAEQRLKRKISKIPVFINLGNYNGFNDNNEIQSFEIFLEQFFSTNGYYSFLANGKWMDFLTEGRVQFYFDALDELPRKPDEYSARTLEIENFVRKWPKVDFVLSCRELDYDVQNTFQQILIKPFNFKHIKKFIKKSFSLEESTVFLDQIHNSESIYKLCENPFYLNLICLYFRGRKELPKNRTELFSFLLDKIIERENCKKNNLKQYLSRDMFISVISDLAYYMTVNRMTTTVVLSDYYGMFYGDLLKHYKNVITSAIACEILEYNTQNDEVRFIHNRFQEYFTSFVFAENYRNNNFKFPDGFFSNIWWRESVLFIAGLDEKPSEFIEIVLKARLNINEKSEVIAKLLDLEILILAFQCTYCSIDKPDIYLREQIRKILIDKFEKGNILERAKIIAVLNNDLHNESQDIINNALNDSSCWLSENAFLLLTGGILRIKMRYRTIINEFYRLFFEGRIFEAFIPIAKSTQQSNKIRRLLPLYILLLLASMLSLIVIPITVILTLKFLIWKMDYEISEYCLRCLLSISYFALIVSWFVVHTEGRLVRRTILLSPLVILSYCMCFYGFRYDDSMVVRYVCMIVGGIFVWICKKFLLRPRSPNQNLALFTAGYLGLYTTLMVLRAMHYPVNSNPHTDALQNVTSVFIQPIIENRFYQSIAQIGNNIDPVHNQREAISILSDRLDTIIAQRRIPRYLITSGISENKIKRKIIDTVNKKLKEMNAQPVQNNDLIFSESIKTGILEGISDVSKIVSKNIVKRYLYTAVLVLISLSILMLIAWQGIIVYKITRQKERIRRILDRHKGNEFDLKNIYVNIQVIKEIWAKKIIVNFITREIATKINRADGSVVLFLNELATLVEQSELKDTVYRMLEKEEREYRRTLKNNLLE